ncbi:hypothetical protein HDV00_002212 [Rhizophlyctis rosea]|nr:hypothetical protein HDV00_002212 [Rhizophlyctis rosea]
MGTMRKELLDYALLEEDLLLAERLQLEEAIRASMKHLTSSSAAYPFLYQSELEANHVDISPQETDAVKQAKIQATELLAEFDNVVAAHVQEAWDQDHRLGTLDFSFATQLSRLEERGDEDDETLDDLQAEDFGLEPHYSHLQVCLLI